MKESLVVKTDTNIKNYIWIYKIKYKINCFKRNTIFLIHISKLQLINNYEVSSLYLKSEICDTEKQLSVINILILSINIQNNVEE